MHKHSCDNLSVANVLKHYTLHLMECWNSLVLWSFIRVLLVLLLCQPCVLQLPSLVDQFLHVLVNLTPSVYYQDAMFI